MAVKKKKRGVLKKKKAAVAKKRPLKKKTVRRKPLKTKKRLRKSAPPVLKKPKEGIIGIVTHYFPKVRAAVIKLKAPLAAGDTIKIKGHTTDFTQKITSMQIDHVPLNSAKKGQEIGLLVNSRVRQNDAVYKA